MKNLIAHNRRFAIPAFRNTIVSVGRTIPAGELVCRHSQIADTLSRDPAVVDAFINDPLCFPAQEILNELNRDEVPSNLRRWLSTVLQGEV